MNNSVDIGDLFAHSALCNQLTNFAISDENVPEIEPEFLTSFEELCLWFDQPLRCPALSINRRWPRSIVIKVTKYCIVHWIADGVGQGMFQSLTTIRTKVLKNSKPTLVQIAQSKYFCGRGLTY